MLGQVLFFAAAFAVIWVFSSVGVFFLCFVWVHYRDHSRTPRAFTLADHMASDLTRQAMKLDAVRLQMFMDWLQRHCQVLETMGVHADGREIQMVLQRWLETFEPDDLHEEYQLLASEITWWRDADEKTLLRCISKEFVERYLSR